MTTRTMHDYFGPSARVIQTHLGYIAVWYAGQISLDAPTSIVAGRSVQGAHHGTPELALQSAFCDAFERGRARPRLSPAARLLLQRLIDGGQVDRQTDREAMDVLCNAGMIYYRGQGTWRVTDASKKWAQSTQNFGVCSGD